MHAQNVDIRTLVVAITLLVQVVYTPLPLHMYTPQHGIYKMALISIYIIRIMVTSCIPRICAANFLWPWFSGRTYVRGIHCVNMIYRDGGGCLYPLYYIDPCLTIYIRVFHFNDTSTVANSILCI